MVSSDIFFLWFFLLRRGLFIAKGPAFFNAKLDISKHLFKLCSWLVNLKSLACSFQIQTFLNVFPFQVLVHITKHLYWDLFTLNLFKVLRPLLHKAVYLLSHRWGEKLYFNLSKVFVFNSIEIKIVKIGRRYLLLIVLILALVIMTCWIFTGIFRSAISF